MIAKTKDNAPFGAVRKTLTMVLKVYFALIVQPVPVIVARVTLSFHSVRELSWPCDLTNAPNVLADLWRWRLVGPVYATARVPPERCGTT
ncbi:hypothetical protein ASF24_12915 [Methylobacterium sp. Leaf86]|nr:hypothetical protein ASF24_12915 [Methylobacterium sp. Leaf86]